MTVVPVTVMVLVMALPGGAIALPAAEPEVAAGVATLLPLGAVMVFTAIEELA